MIITEEVKDTFSKREMLMFRALEIVGRLLRKNPMGNLDDYPPGLINVIAGGSERDPEGAEYISYFLNQATKELLKEGKI